jgi:hypothetical protein
MAFTESEGNPREAIRFLIPRLDEILFDKKEAEVPIQEDYVIKLTASVVLDSIVKALTIAAKPFGIDVELQVSGAGTQKQQVALVELTKDGATEYVGIDLPNVKDWDRSGGVAAYYSANRLKKVLDAEAVKAAVMAVPTKTKGVKFEALSEEIGDKMLTIRLDEETATQFVRETGEGVLPHGYAESFTGLVDGLFG